MNQEDTSSLYKTDCLAPKRIRNARLQHTFCYRGSSMRPTFSSAAFIFVYASSELIIGDVLVFYDPKKHIHIVHRLVAFKKEKMVTRGDNNLFNDHALLTMDRVLGRVEYWEHKGQLLSVQGGRIALYTARLKNTLWHLGNRCRLLLKKPYHFFRDLGLCRVLCAHWVNQHLSFIRIRHNKDFILKVLLKGKVVAWASSSSGRINYIKPYDLILPKCHDLRLTLKEKGTSPVESDNRLPF